MKTHAITSSSSLRAIAYVPFADTAQLPEGVPSTCRGFLITTFNDGAQYAHAVPSWVVGLIMAAPSRGRAWGRLVRHKYPSVKLRKRQTSS